MTKKLCALKTLRKRPALLKALAIFMALNLWITLVTPSISFALTSGPGSPEFASFEPVATTDMVNTLTGDFTYNLPVLNVPGPGGGYALSLSYHSGVSSEEEASWVGYGWTLNPGAINRNSRGIPDDYKETPIEFYGKMRPNWTSTATKYGELEIFSSSKDKRKKMMRSEMGPALFSPKGQVSLRYNNYNGFSRSIGFSTSFKGLGTVGMNYGNQGVTFSGAINPVAIYKAVEKGRKTKKERAKDQEDIDKKIGAREGGKSGMANTIRETKSFQNYGQKLAERGAMGTSIGIAGSSYGLLSYNNSYPASSINKYDGFSLNINKTAGITANIFPIGIEGGIMGSLNLTYTPVTTKRKANGYLFNFKKKNENEIISDYFVEKDHPFNKQDHHLGIPFSSPDNFALTGEGLAGSFRFHNPKVGHFYPNFSTSNMKTFNIGREFMVGMALDVGIDLGAGLQLTTTSDWRNSASTDQMQFSEEDKPFARFRGDLAGEIVYGEDENTNSLFTSSVYKFPNGLGGSEGNIANLNPSQFYLNGEKEQDEAIRSVGRGSYINPELIDNKLHNFEIFNEDGVRYSYGERKYNNGKTSGATNFIKNETNLAFDVEEAIIPQTTEKGGICKIPHLVEKEVLLYNEDGKSKADHCDHEMVTGEIKTESYANIFLLGEITSPQYVDVKEDGPTEDDFGAWTKFEYHQKYGRFQDDWYRWRMPYTGLLFNKNSISDERDDAGSLSTGEKEVHYLKSIETKTYQAFFITNLTKPSRFGFNDDDDKVRVLMGSQKPRKDSRGAILLENQRAYDPASKHYDDLADPNDNFKKDLPQLEFLEKVVLIPKERIKKIGTWGNSEDLIPVSTTYFDYDYSQVPNLPNNIHGNYPHSNKATEPNSSGKLTLKKIWTEYEGVKNAKISPYQFDYRYKESKFWNENVREAYPGMESFFNLSDQYDYYTEQNPSYSPHLLGPWGFNQPNAEDQLCAGRDGIYQGPINEDLFFDPGAWHLKQIKLPSGGEILVEYEEKDYSYVQDRKAMTLASLTGIIENEKSPGYTINVEDLGLNPEDDNFEEDLNAQIALLQNYFEENKGYIYFKFLFALAGLSPDLNDCKSEFITGYCKVKEITKSTDNKSITITLDGKRNDAKEGYVFTPKQGCKDYYLAKKMGQYQEGCHSSYGTRYANFMKSLMDTEDCPDNGSPGKDLKGMLAIAKMANQLIDTLATQKPKPGKYCLTIAPESSFLKLPMLKSKRGGGPRVKRLITYDAGLENGDEAIYGTEYHYIFKNGESSGVATTEPGGIREENALVNFMPRHHQNWLKRHVVGENKEQSEGPLGESLLPAASIAYARVLQSNIHKGPTGAGFSIQEFYTCKDFPFDRIYNYSANKGDFDFARDKQEKGVDFTDLKSNTKRDFLPIVTGVFNVTTNKSWAAQGFRFIQHDMHGKPKSTLSFGGTLSPDGKPDPSTNYLVQGQTFDYHLPGEKVRAMNFAPNDDGVMEKKLEWINPGKETDITMEMKSVQDVSVDFQLEVDLCIGLALPPPVTVAAFPYLSMIDAGVSTHTTSKVIYYPCLTKSITQFRDGVATKTEHLAYDQRSGLPILTASGDEYYNIPKGQDQQDLQLDKVLSLNIPANWIYNEMGKKSDDPSFSNLLKTSAGSILTYGKEESILDDVNKSWNYPEKVLNASMQTFKTSKNYPGWFNERIAEEYNITPEARKKLDKIWRPFESSVYRRDATNTMVDPTLKNYEEGLALYEPFDHNGFNDYRYWIRQNRATAYSPHGEPVEELYDFSLWRHNAVIYGYNHTQPIMVASNAELGSIAFMDFEQSAIPTNGVKTFVAHSGQQGLEFSNPSPIPFTLINNLQVTENLVNYGGNLKFWVNKEKSNYYSIYAGINLSPNIEAKPIARVGEWELMECVIPKENFIGLSGELTVDLYLFASNLIIDDVRFQSNASQAVCYVYDPSSRRMITSFDDQHFGQYFQYNDEGKLTKKIIETERGKRTVEETQYNLPVVKR